MKPPDTRVERLARAWSRRVAVSGLLRGVATAVLLGALGEVSPLPPSSRWILLAASAAVGGAVALAHRAGQPRGAAVMARHLDRRVPALEDSSELLLQDPAMLPPLQRRQRRRVEQRLESLARAGLLPGRPLAAAAVLLALGLVGAVGVLGTVPRWRAARRAAPLRVASPALADRPATDLAPEAVVLRVVPPAYTGRPPRQAAGLDATAEEGARVEWEVLAAGPRDAARLLLEGQEVPLRLRGGTWQGSVVARATRLYRLELRSGDRAWRSPAARLVVIPDRPPTLRWLEPPPVVEVEAGAGPLSLRLEAADDHGVGGAALVVTVASGSGEQVRFGERRLDLRLLHVGGGRVHLEQQLDLGILGLGPGGEAYYHAEVADRREPIPNVARSPVQVVRAPAEGGDALPLALGLPPLLPPQSFRSQRQVLMDTLRLLAERPALAAAEVARRSRSLAADQRAVRMRYGGLLGEEFVDGRPLEDEHAVEGAVPGVHQHDSAESNTYFPDEARRTLKAALAAMWDAEGTLGTVRPDDAVPHEERALELLKRVQEAERVYVGKLGYRPEPLRPGEVRLTGDLSGVEGGRWRPAAPAAAGETARRALQALAAGPPWGGAGLVAALAPVAPEVRRLAREGEADLRAVDALDLLLGGAAAGPPAEEDMTALRRALWRLLPEPLPAPARGPAAEGRLVEAWRNRRRER